MSPPGARTAPTAGNPDHRIGNTKKVDLSYPLSYADPTGEQAIRNAAALLGKQLGWDQRSDFKIIVTGGQLPTPGGELKRSKIPIHVDDELTRVLIQVMAQVAEFKETRSGLGFRASIKKNTPDTVSLFGDTDGVEGHIETPT